jgi:hypothetical protein
MQRQPRLSRSEVIARLRALAAQHGGAVSARMLATHDSAVLRSLRIHFPSFAVACRAARVEVARPPSRSAPRPSPSAAWSKDRVVDELQRLDSEGASTGWAELMQQGQGALVAAAAAHAGGLQQARAEAGVEAPERRPPTPRWDRAGIAAAIQEQARAGQPLASSKAPQRLVAAARWHFGSWEAALEAADVDPEAVRLQRGPLTPAEILERIRALARDGTEVRASTLKAVVKLDTVRKLFGSIEAAVREAGIEPVATHGNLKWTPERVVDELKARAARGETRLSRALARAVQLCFGGAHAARAAAGLRPLVRIAWTRPSLIVELQRLARRGDRGRALWSACTRLFGSVAKARRAAGLRASRRTGMAAWDRRALLAELRRRLQTRQQLGRGLTEGLRREFGSLAAARAAARRGRRRSSVAVARSPGRARGPRAARGAGRAGGAAVRVERPWTARRVRQALREPGVEVADPDLIAACIYHFGSVTAARAAVARRRDQREWSKATVIAELQARAQRGLKGVGRLLRDPAVRLFGSTEAALEAARTAPPLPRAAGPVAKR